MKPNLKGTLILILTAFIWGTAFVAQTAAAGNISAFFFTGSRSVLACVFLFLFVALREKIRRKNHPQRAPLFEAQTVKAGILCGIPLCIASNLQQIGITLYPQDAAASGRAGFLTATYVLMVAFYTLIKTKRFRPLVLFAGVICMAGIYFLSVSDGLHGIYVSDILILACAFFFAVYILLVDRYGTVDTIKVSCIQFTVCALLSLAAAFLFEAPAVSALRSAWFPTLYAGLLSSGVAYTLQMVGQKYAEPVIATIVMSLESVFAALSGWLILSEKLKGRELFGCVLVFAAVILAQFPERNKN